jgi:hypothetical protein
MIMIIIITIINKDGATLPWIIVLVGNIWLWLKKPKKKQDCYCSSFEPNFCNIEVWDVTAVSALHPTFSGPLDVNVGMSAM